MYWQHLTLNAIKGSSQILQGIMMIPCWARVEEIIYGFIGNTCLHKTPPLPIIINSPYSNFISFTEDLLAN
jgi:hypothetical protein